MAKPLHFPRNPDNFQAHMCAGTLFAHRQPRQRNSELIPKFWLESAYPFILVLPLWLELVMLPVIRRSRYGMSNYQTKGTTTSMILMSQNRVNETVFLRRQGGFHIWRPHGRSWGQEMQQNSGTNSIEFTDRDGEGVKKSQNYVDVIHGSPLRTKIILSW